MKKLHIGKVTSVEAICKNYKGGDMFMITLGGDAWYNPMENYYSKTNGKQTKHWTIEYLQQFVGKQVIVSICDTSSSCPTINDIKEV